jgi:hypothetical protein
MIRTVRVKNVPNAAHILLETGTTLERDLNCVVPGISVPWTVCASPSSAWNKALLSCFALSRCRMSTLVSPLLYATPRRDPHLILNQDSLL